MLVAINSMAERSHLPMNLPSIMYIIRKTESYNGVGQSIVTFHKITFCPLIIPGSLFYFSLVVFNFILYITFTAIEISDSIELN
jgi:hypothetical protein